MKKIIERLLVFFIGVPAIFCLVLFLPQFNNLALNLVVVFFSSLGAVELSAMLEKKNIKISKVESYILGAFIPLSLTLVISVGLSVWIAILSVIAAMIWALISRIFSRKTEIETITNKVIGCFSLLVYPGFFMGFIILMSGWGNPAATLLFLLITFANDSLAWLFGTLFGANNKGIITVSPNKSIAGFIGGIFGSIIIVICAAYFFPSVFTVKGLTLSEFINNKHFLSSAFSGQILVPAIILGLCAGIAAILGDLAESAMKRSCDFKDSGNFMLGRGGVLDSIDSIAVAAPVFFLLFIYFFNAL